VVERFRPTLSDSFVPILQFEPERFVEGLLGIGVAGGGSSKSKSNEGAILAARLVEMRKERDARDKGKKVAAPAAKPSPQPVMANTPSPNGAAQNPNRKKNKNKKNKGGKK
jgi:hypothetical protein